VIIVDASDYWETTRDEVAGKFAEHWRHARLVYEPARVRSTAYQRNQALEASRSDIVFSLDDDIYLRPDAASIIMEVYERDVDEEIAMVGGQFVHALHDSAPSAADESAAAARRGPAALLKSWMERGLTLERHFVPYDRPIRLDAPPSSVSDLNVFPAGLLNGGRTTFRRRFGQALRWSELLRYYATHEDSDFSYRLSHLGRVLVAPDAGFFHADGAEDRPDRFKTNTIRVRNLMALHRVSSDNRLRSWLRLLASFSYFTGLYLLIDPARRRYSLPSARAYALGALQIPFFLFMPFKDFSAWYLAQQEKMHGVRNK
jgi:GT2 family glycosyltransferase